jgi:hypothetical protein
MSIPVVGISHEERVKSASHSRDQSVVGVRGEEIYSNTPEVRSFSCPLHEPTMAHRELTERFKPTTLLVAEEKTASSECAGPAPLSMREQTEPHRVDSE